MNHHQLIACYVADLYCTTTQVVKDLGTRVVGPMQVTVIQVIVIPNDSGSEASLVVPDLAVPGTVPGVDLPCLV